jgi:hypothetical protein
MKANDGFRIREKLLSKLKDREYFTEDEVNEIFTYKGMEHHANQDARKITEKVFASQDMGEKFRLLKRLNGVGIVMASNILMFQNPHKFAETNHISWNILASSFGLKAPEKDARSDYSVQEVEIYLTSLKSLSDEYGMNVADVEYVLSHAG